MDSGQLMPRRQLLRGGLASACVLSGVAGGVGAGVGGCIWPRMALAQPVPTPSAQAPTPALAQPEAVRYPTVTAGQALQFPRDHGAHPEYRTEWWYLTGWLHSPDAPAADRDIGFQLTLFRSRPPIAALNSRYAPTQLMLAHAALALPSQQRLVHAQASARWWAEHPRLRMSTKDTDLAMDGWQLQRRQTPSEHYQIQLNTDALQLDLTITPTTGHSQGQAQAQSPWLQGDRGYSRKGPRAEQASWYYSRPQLAVRGRWRVSETAGKAERSAKSAASSDPQHAWHKVSSGVGWLDHEWASSVLDRRASGWDWVGLNLDDGRALMAFQIRQQGEQAAPLWQTIASWPAASRGDQLRFEPRRWWTSPRTQVRYPVAQTLHLHLAGQALSLELEPLFDDQELDGRQSTGIVYWEGAVRVMQQEGSARRQIGRGYLELTGYHAPLRL